MPLAQPEQSAAQSIVSRDLPSNRILDDPGNIDPFVAAQLSQVELHGPDQTILEFERVTGKIAVSSLV